MSTNDPFVRLEITYNTVSDNYSLIEFDKVVITETSFLAKKFDAMKRHTYGAISLLHYFIYYQLGFASGSD
jgi:hypothetical protein